MKRYHSFGKSVMTALFVTIFIGATLGCAEDSPEDEPVLQSIVVTSLPTKVVYTVGEALNLSGLEVTGMYPGGKSKVESVSLSNISGYNPNTVGQQTLTVTVSGKTTTFFVIVTTGATGGDATLQSIMVTHLPTKVVYSVGEALSLSGLEVTGIYANGTTKKESVTLANISGYNANTVGQQSVTVTVNGKTTTFMVTVNAGSGGDATLQSIAITSQPTKTVYAQGEALNLSGLEVTGTYSNGTTKTETVDISNISGYDAETTGPQTVTVTVNGQTATFSVSVNVILQNITEVMTELTNAPGGLIAASPVSLRLKLNLTTSEWKDLLDGIAAVGKYVSLDLSACTMSGTAFDPGTDVNADKVAALVLPDTAKSIRAGTKDNPTFKAFTALRSLSGVGVETIGDWAFTDYCTSLTSVNLPVATFVGFVAFAGCTGLTSISLPAATTIDDEAFADCTSLTEVNLPVATTIGGGAFQDCTSLTTVSLPAATTIGESAFSRCTSLTEVSLPVATTIGGDGEYDYDGAFSGCTSLTDVSLPAATNIGNYTFSGTNLTTVSLPAATDIGSSAFYNTNLTTVSLPAATTIGYSAFSGTNLTTVSLPKAETISGSAFSGCTSLTEVSLPAATDIGGGTSSSDGAFYGCTNLTAVDLPVATTIGGYAFSGTKLTTVSLPAVTTISAYTFRGCASLTSVSLPAVTTIGDRVNIGAYTYFGAFSGTKLTTVDLPAATTIGSSAFYGCDSLVSVSLPAAQTIGGGAFQGCATLTAVSLPAAQTIGGQAFWDCESLATVSLPAATSIGYRAFYGCTNLTSVSLPAAETIGTQAFYGCTSLTSVSLPAATTIGGGTSSSEGAFYGCTSLTSVSLPAATSIDWYVFESCTSLTEVSLPMATTIGSFAFYNCTSLTTVSLPATPPSISTGYHGSIFAATGSNSSGTITVRVPAGAVSAYTSAWGVDAETPANSNSKYGGSHKAVIITDAAQ